MHRAHLVRSIVVAASALCALPSNAADFTVRDLTTQFFHADRANPLHFSGRDLRELDLSGLDFKGATVVDSNLFGADLSRADLSQTSFKGSRLDRVIIIGTRFDGADLSGTSLLRPSTFSTLVPTVSEAASFKGTNLANARLFGRFTRMNFHEANLSGATMAPFNHTGFIEHIWRTDLSGADVSNADLSRANLTYVLFAFANLRGANLSGAVLRKADLSRADLTGANLTGADLSEADLDGAILMGTRGLDTALGLDTARNFEKSVR
jgi:uncharacterized protein YjbI with pentapeptide repeats